MKPQDLTRRLTDACQGGSSALRIVTHLAPAGGAGDKLFPPTYEGGRYATEKRRIDGQEVEAVLLDSVQSQANRMEAALLGAFRAGRCDIPLFEVTIPRLNGETVVTALDAPHRLFDAIFRDSLLNGKKFRESPLGKRLVDARLDNATAVWEACPTALIFGMWDSTGGGGTMGFRMARALTSEIVGLHAVFGRKTSSRIDPLGIEKESATIWESDTDMWTLNKDEAAQDSKGKPKLYGKASKAGKPSAINHGNVTPSISEDVEPRDIVLEDQLQTDRLHHRLNLAVRRPAPHTQGDRPTSGGVTISEAVQTTVLSFPQLRRLYFPDPESRKSRPERDVAGRAVLAALALYAVALQKEEGYFLRSRCQLIPLKAPDFEFIGLTAQEIEAAAISTDLAHDAFEEAVKQAKKQGLAWKAGVIELKPTDKLKELVRRSDEKVKATGGDENASS